MCPLCCCNIFYGVLNLSFQIELVLVRQHIVKVLNCVQFEPDDWSQSLQKKLNQAFNWHIQSLIDRIFRKGLRPRKVNTICKILNGFVEELVNNNSNNKGSTKKLFLLRIIPK